MAEPTLKPDQRFSPLKRKSPQESIPVPDDAPPSDPAPPLDVAPQNIKPPDQVNPALPNGVPRIDVDSSPVSSVSNAKRLPPEIQHVTDQFQSLSKLFGRLSQECFNSLNDLITELSNLGDAGQVNGVSAGGSPSSPPEASVTRRLKWLHWAHAQRQKFIQLLVILQWTRKLPEVSRLIDVNNFLRIQEDAIGRAWEDFGLVKRGAASTIVPGPNIPTALQLLRGTRESTLPALIYNPPKPLSASTILDTVHNLNILLHTRLNVHEDLPEYLQNYEIHDGKVTFRVPNEFEVDLIIADEDPASQFWFVDLRLLFSSVSEFPAGNLTAAIQKRVDDALSAKGLIGCFEVLHEFCMTLKISVLRQQAIALNRAVWAGYLKVDQHSRSLIIQYWCGRSTKKSWIQVGVKRGKPTKSFQECEYWPSNLFLKWVRHGREAPMSGILDLATATMEHILKCVIAQHVSITLLSIKQSLDQSAKGPVSPLIPILFTSETEPSECVLRLSARPKRNLNLYVQSVSGMFVLQPATPASARFENELNSMDTTTLQWSYFIERWLASETLNRLRSDIRAARFLVEDLPGANRESIRKLFGPDTIEIMVTRRKSWRPSDWYIVFAAHLHHESVWVARLATHNRMLQVSERYQLEILRLENALRSGPDWAVSGLEEIAVARITKEALQQRLGYDVTIQRGDTGHRSGSSSVAFDIAPLLRGSHLPKSDSTVILDNKKVLLICCGFRKSTDGTTVLRYVVKGSIKKSIAQSGALSIIDGGNFSFTPDGPFSFTTESELGSAAPIDAVVSRITALEQVGVVLRTLRQHQLDCQSAQLDGLTFRYAGDETLAHISFTKAGALQLEHLAPPPMSNPTVIRRLNDLLRSHSNAATSFPVLLHTLVFTLPLLRALAALGTSDPTGARVRYFMHDLTSYSILYLPLSAQIKITFTNHRGEAYWMFRLSVADAAFKSDSRVRKFAEAFGRVCTTPKTGWAGNARTAAAPLNVVEVLVRGFDMVANLAIDGEDRRAIGGGASGVTGVAAGQAHGVKPGQQPSVPPQAQRAAPTARQGKGSSGQEIVVIDP